MKPAISVILCTYQPAPAYLARTLAGLRAQTLDAAEWELLVVDNASPDPLETSLTAWHPRGRVVREEQLGLTAARLRGLAESAGGLLVFVDDDNVLAPDYLAQAAQLAAQWPRLGVWGGQTRPVFEKAPPHGARDPWLWLAIREFEQDRWSNNPEDGDCFPFGAGLCARREVMTAYAERLAHDPVRRALDRTGENPLGCGDTDLVLTAFDLGWGAGLFAALQLEHLIPPQRLEEGYLLRLVQGTVYSSTLLSALRGRRPARQSWLGKIRRFFRLRKLSQRDRAFERARDRGFAAALRRADSLPQPGALS